MFKTIMIANMYGKTLIFILSEHCQFKDFYAYFPSFNSWRQTPSGNTTKMDILCAEIFALSANASGIFFKALNHWVKPQNVGNCREWVKQILQ